MKKVTAILALVFMLSVVLVGCQGQDESSNKVAKSALEGTTWTLESMVEPDGETTAAAELMAEFGGEMIYEFKADGVFTLTAGSKGKSDGTYKEEGGKTIMEAKGSAPSTVTIEGDELTVENENGKAIFKKK